MSQGCYLCVFGVSVDRYEEICNACEGEPGQCIFCLNTATCGYDFDSCKKHPIYCEECVANPRVRILKTCPICNRAVKESDLGLLVK